MTHVKAEDLRPDDFVALEDLTYGDEVVDSVQEMPGDRVAVLWVGWSRTRTYKRDQQFRVLNR